MTGQTPMDRGQDHGQQAVPRRQRAAVTDRRRAVMHARVWSVRPCVRASVRADRPCTCRSRVGGCTQGRLRERERERERVTHPDELDHFLWHLWDCRAGRHGCSRQTEATLTSSQTQGRQKPGLPPRSVGPQLPSQLLGTALEVRWADVNSQALYANSTPVLILGDWRSATGEQDCFGGHCGKGKFAHVS